MSDTAFEEIHTPESIADVRSRLQGSRKRLYLETYGCQMNVYDSELVASIMRDMDYDLVDDYETADAIFMNTCAIRENAEQRVWGQLTRFKKLKEEKPHLIIGVLGCMAKHLEEEIHAKRPYVNVVLGPDSYRKIPELIEKKQASQNLVQIRLPAQNAEDFSLSEYRDFQLKPLQMDTRLSRTEVYDQVEPLRLGKITAWIAIMRGCDNFCTFCVVPYTRGRERSRSVESIVEEVHKAVAQGYTEIGLLGQNVNSYRDPQQKDFAELMNRVSEVLGVRRIRFTSPHPKDFPEHLLHIIAQRDNICKQLHIPVQSGSNRILELMNRTYTREEYLKLIDTVRRIIPDVSISTDIITGFPSETERDHLDTVELFRTVQFDSAFMFKYSARIGTKAYTMPDDVTEAEKSRRLQQIIEVQKENGLKSLHREIGKEREVLIEEVSRKSDNYYCARTDKGQIIIIPKSDKTIGEYARIRIARADGHTLFGEYI